MAKNWDFGEYEVAAEPSKRDRAYAWMTAIGLQKVDGLQVSDYLLETARRNIEGEISQDEVVRIIDRYYETREGQAEPQEREEADKVSARINRVVNLPGFNLSPVYYLGLHRLIFEGVFAHAGKIRDVELSKKEWVLNEDSVSYTPSALITDTLEYEFERERRFNFAGLSELSFTTHISEFISSIWQIHPFREGNTRTAAVFVIKYLQEKGYKVTNALFEKNSWYFRNALVRANYQNQKLNIQRTLVPLEEFFRVLLFDEHIDLKNRYLHVDVEHSGVDPYV